VSLARKQERMRRETVVSTMLAIATWLEKHADSAMGKYGTRLADFYCPSKSGDAAVENAAKALRAMAIEQAKGPEEWSDDVGTL
jgi:hypothetical protein